MYIPFYYHVLVFFPHPISVLHFDTQHVPFRKLLPCSRELEHAGEEESVVLEGDIGGGLVLQRQIYFPKNAANTIQINSSIIARKVGAGSGGFSRFYLKLVLYPDDNIIIYVIYDNCWSYRVLNKNREWKKPLNCYYGWCTWLKRLSTIPYLYWSDFPIGK